MVNLLIGLFIGVVFTWISMMLGIDVTIDELMKDKENEVNVKP